MALRKKPGPTTKPHNAAHTPGGSSSGSAAAVADCMLPLALGTQTGGSVIRPAASASTLSPTAWPCSSFTCLNPSRSMK